MPMLTRMALALSLLAHAWLRSEPAQIVVPAGKVERTDALVTVTMPTHKSKVFGLRGPDGAVLAAQADVDGLVTFLVPKVPANQPVTFTVAPAPSSTPEVIAAKQGRKLRFTHAGKTILEYQMEPGDLPRAGIAPEYRRGGYLHPVFTPSGRVVTDDFPAKHTHHHGIWFPWTKTEFEGHHPDFWNMGAGTGRVEFVALQDTWSGPVHAGFRATHRFVDLSIKPPKPVLEETWSLTVYARLGGAKQRWVFDLVSTQRCAGSKPLRLPQYHYGGLGFRGHASWDTDTNNPTRFLTSAGETNRVVGHATRARWCHIGGAVEGTLAGVAVLCHPTNFRAPQPMRLHPSEPFFNFAPQQFADMEIAPGSVYVSRYRFVIADGAPDAAELERMWDAYSRPPVAELRGQPSP